MRIFSDNAGEYKDIFSYVRSCGKGGIMIKTIIFDIDQTLYNYNDCHSIALKTIDDYCADNQILPPGELSRLWKIVFEEVMDRLGFDNANSHDTMLRIQTILEKKGVNPLPVALKIHHLYWDTVLENMKLYEWVLPFFKEVKKLGLCCGIATDLTVEIQFKKLIKLGITDQFDFIVTSEEANSEKPHAGIFEMCLQKANCTAQECFMIGDNWNKDIIGAQNMGMSFAWHVPNQNFEDLDPEKRPYAFSSCLELYKVFQQQCHLV